MASQPVENRDRDVLEALDFKHAELARCVEDMRSDLREIARAVAYLSQRVAAPGAGEPAAETPGVPTGPRGFDR